MKKILTFAIVMYAVMALSAMPVFSQDQQSPVKEEQAPAAAAVQAVQEPVQQEEPAKTKELSIYGEIQAVNAAASTMTVQYYDYDNDEEKTLEVTLDKDSKLENVKTIAEINKGDWADITYIAAGGKSVAKMISVEKEELAAEENAPAEAAE